MKITPYLLSVPPYLSTPWKNIASLHVDGEGILQISLKHNKAMVGIPHLTPEEVKEIFDGYQLSLEKREEIFSPLLPFTFSLPFKGELPLPTSPMEHNPEQAATPPLPPPVLKKILLIVKAFGLLDSIQGLKTEPHCNCLSCQLLREAAQERGESQIEEERVDESELTFRSWDIAPEGEKLYRVSNPLDPAEHYQVFLGEPLGCTCGEKGCEHIRAVLNEPC